MFASVFRNCSTSAGFDGAKSLRSPSLAKDQRANHGCLRKNATAELTEQNGCMWSISTDNAESETPTLREVALLHLDLR